MMMLMYVVVMVSIEVFDIEDIVLIFGECNLFEVVDFLFDMVWLCKLFDVFD